MIERLSVRHLRTLRILRETQNMRETAARVGRSQPAISLQIKDLEEIVGFRLIYHRRGRIVFTTPGETFASLAGQIEAQLSDRIETIRGQSEMRLRFGVTHDIHDACRFEAGHFAEYGIALEPMTSGAILHAHAAGTIDAGIAKTTSPRSEAAISWSCVLNWIGSYDDLIPAAPLRLVLLDAGCFYHHLALTLFAGAAPAAVELVICESWREVSAHLCSGGVTIVPAHWPDFSGTDTCPRGSPNCRMPC